MFVDSNGNIYIGELNQITLWPANSDESFPVINISRSNGAAFERNYKNMIQMDNNGSLYLLSTDREIFGNKILKYRCDSK